MESTMVRSSVAVLAVVLMSLVSQGQEITVRSSQAGATASVEGIAQTDGSAGSSILVLSPWGRRIRCLVLKDGSARSLE